MYLLLVAVILITFSIYKYTTKPITLYDRLGGIYNIAAVIDNFSDKLIKNPIVGINSNNPQLRDWHTRERNHLNRLPGLKFMRTLWVADVAGGPYKFCPSTKTQCPFSSLNLSNQHKRFKITSDEFDAVAKELSNTLDEFKVPNREKQDILSAFAAHKKNIVASYA
jgi:hemoglobin